MGARLALIGLSECRRFSLFRHQLSGGADCLHQDRLVFGCVADDHAEFATLAPVDVHFRNHLGGVQIEAVSLRTLHNAQASAFFGCAFIVNHLCDVIHAIWFLFLRGNGRIADLQFNIVLFGPLTGDLVSTLHRRQVLG